MGAQGQTTVDFGVFPGGSDVQKDVNTVGVVAASLIEAWIAPVATADHSVDEHVVETISVKGTFLSNDNIRIRAINSNQVQDTDPLRPDPRIYGVWTVNWVWN